MATVHDLRNESFMFVYCIILLYYNNIISHRRSVIENEISGIFLILYTYMYMQTYSRIHTLKLMKNLNWCRKMFSSILLRAIAINPFAGNVCHCGLYFVLFSCFSFRLCLPLYYARRSCICIYMYLHWYLCVINMHQL